ncbi:MAG: rhodanese-like domain-containing protein [Xanthomonadales bacterium]|nr:rhodanese-like domain-containing protein [Gammaproteobacteria bacterium]NNK03227.1 rhodanese-like domain-containing protein [Xanthomonadales bacterium]NNK97789.1 rhodanese-like domain-containing protein [Xanthomonadales bacterium]
MNEQIPGPPIDRQETKKVEQLVEFAGNHIGLVAGFTAVVLLLIWTEISRKTRGYTEITPLQAVQKINQDETAIVDISTAADFSNGHLAGAKHFAMSRFNKPDPEIEKIAQGPVLVVCKNGNTAHQAATKLVKLGANDVAVLKGGTTRWAADQYPLSRK